MRVYRRIDVNNYRKSTDEMITTMDDILRRALTLSVVAVMISALAEAAPNRSNLSAKVDAAVRQQMEEQRIPGLSLAVVRDGQVIKAQGYGFANLEVHAAVVPETIFEAGSITKQFTATAIMLLAEEGRISIDDSITRYFPDAPQALKAVTIRHLLTHTSGLPNVDFGSEEALSTKGIVDFHRAYTEDELAHVFLAQPLDFEPGTKWSYCNTGYELLGILIHRVTGKYYGDFLRERILTPLGMSTASIFSFAEIIPNRASGYDLINGAWKNSRLWVSESLYSTADGGLLASVLDLAKWDAGLASGRVLKQSSLDVMWAPVPLDDGSAYPSGMGWFIARANGHRIVFHTGGSLGFYAAISRYLDDRLTFIVMTNISENHADVMKIIAKVADLYLPDTKGVNPIKDWQD